MTAALAPERHRTAGTRHSGTQGTAARTATARAATSTAASIATVPRRAAAPASGRPQLRVLDQVGQRRRARRRNALVAAFVMVLAGLFLVAYVHATLVGSQQDLDQMRTRLAEIEAEKASVQRDIEELSSPERIVDRARQLGRVPAAEPVFLVAAGDSARG